MHTAISHQTNISIEVGAAWFKSEGSIRMAEGLGYPWRLAMLGRVVPLSIRDRLYRWIARHRFHLFGKLGSCYLPAAQYAD